MMQEFHPGDWPADVNDYKVPLESSAKAQSENEGEIPICGDDSIVGQLRTECIVTQVASRVHKKLQCCFRVRKKRRPMSCMGSLATINISPCRFLLPFNSCTELCISWPILQNQHTSVLQGELHKLDNDEGDWNRMRHNNVPLQPLLSPLSMFCPTEVGILIRFP